MWLLFVDGVTVGLLGSVETWFVALLGVWDSSFFGCVFPCVGFPVVGCACVWLVVGVLQCCLRTV